jgi:membrane protein required for colicin V production
MTPYDIFALIVVLASALAGFVRGATREIVTLVAFTCSLLAAFLVLPLTGPLMRKMVDPDWIGTVAAVIIIFLVAYFSIHALGGWLRDRLNQTDHLGGIDRLLGLGVGVIRAFVLIGVFHLVFSAVTPPERAQPWFTDAKIFPASAAAAKTLQKVLPSWARLADKVAPAVESSARKGASDRPQSTDTRPAAYDPGQRADMDALVETSR